MFSRLGNRRSWVRIGDDGLVSLCRCDGQA
jgi:hypothetical protein